METQNKEEIMELVKSGEYAVKLTNYFYGKSGKVFVPSNKTGVFLQILPFICGMSLFILHLLWDFSQP
jgi:hypothetical protein